MWRTVYHCFILSELVNTWASTYTTFDDSTFPSRASSYKTLSPHLLSPLTITTATELQNYSKLLTVDSSTFNSNVPAYQSKSLLPSSSPLQHLSGSYRIDLIVEIKFSARRNICEENKRDYYILFLLYSDYIADWWRLRELLRSPCLLLYDK